MSNNYLYGANSTWTAIQNARQEERSYTTVAKTFNIISKSSSITLPIERATGDRIVSIALDSFFNTGIIDTADEFLLQKTNFGLGGALALTQDNSIKEIHNTGNVTDYLLPGVVLPDGEADIDNNRFYKFLDPTNKNNLTYVMNPEFNFIVIRAPDFLSRYDFNGDANEGVLGVAKPSGNANGVGNNYEFVNAAQDAAKTRTLIENVTIEFMHESLISDYEPMKSRRARPIYFSTPYELVCTVFLKRYAE